MRFSLVIGLFVLGRVWAADVDAGDDGDCTMRVGVDEGMPLNQLLVQVDDGILEGHLGLYRGTPNDCRKECVDLGCYVFEYTVSSQECFLYETYKPIGGVITIIRKPRQKVILFIVEADGPFDDIDEGPITQEQLNYLNDRYLSAYKMAVAPPVCGSPTTSDPDPVSTPALLGTTTVTTPKRGEDEASSSTAGSGGASTPDVGLTSSPSTPAVSEASSSSTPTTDVPSTSSLSPTPPDSQASPLSTDTTTLPTTSNAQTTNTTTTEPIDEKSTSDGRTTSDPSTTTPVHEISSASTPDDILTTTPEMTSTSGPDDVTTRGSTPEVTTPQETTSSPSSSSSTTTFGTTMKPVPAGMISFNNNRFVVKYGQIFTLPAVAASARELQVNTFKGCTVFVTLKDGTQLVKPYRTEPYTDTVDGVIAVSATCV